MRKAAPASDREPPASSTIQGRTTRLSPPAIESISCATRNRRPSRDRRRTPFTPRPEGPSAAGASFRGRRPSARSSTCLAAVTSSSARPTGLTTTRSPGAARPGWRPVTTSQSSATPRAARVEHSGGDQPLGVAALVRRLVLPVVDDEEIGDGVQLDRPVEARDEDDRDALVEPLRRERGVDGHRRGHDDGRSAHRFLGARRGPHVEPGRARFARRRTRRTARRAGRRRAPRSARAWRCEARRAGCGPARRRPIRHATREPATARCRTARPVTAPVRIALTTVPSITASGRPVARSDRRTSAFARGRPFRSGLSGTLGIHFRPATSNSPPTYAGMAMIRPSRSSVPGPSDHVIMTFGGMNTSPRGLHGEGARHHVDHRRHVGAARSHDVLLAQIQELGRGRAHGSTNTTCTSPGPCTPRIRFCSMSAVRLGPVTSVTADETASSGPISRSAAPRSGTS